jgi:hypothetical protein
LETHVPQRKAPGVPYPVFPVQERFFLGEEVKTYHAQLAPVPGETLFECFKDARLFRAVFEEIKKSLIPEAVQVQVPGFCLVPDAAACSAEQVKML